MSTVGEVAFNHIDEGTEPLIGAQLRLGQACEARIHPVPLLFDDAPDPQDHVGQLSDLLGMLSGDFGGFGDQFGILRDLIAMGLVRRDSCAWFAARNSISRSMR